MTLDEIKAAIKGACNLTSTEADTRVGASINRHYRRITSLIGMDSTRFVTRSTTTTAGVRSVTFSEIEKIDRVIDTTDSEAIRLLTEIGQHAQRSAQPGTGAPCSWALQSSGADEVTILLDTIPQETYSLQADGWATLADLQGNDVPAFPESFHDVLTWFVLSEELLRKEKDRIALTYEQKAEKLLSDLRFHLVDSPTRVTKQRSADTSTATTGSSSGGGGTLGGTAYTQSGLVTFDLGASVAPFAVAQPTAATVTNLDADKLDGEDSAFFLDRGNHTGALAATDLSVTATDRLLGRDTAGAGAVEELTATGGIEFTGTGIQTSAFTGDVTKTAGGTALTIASDAVTTAKILDDNVTDAKLRESAACSVIGRSANSTGNPADITTATNNTLLARISDALTWVSGLVFDGLGRVQQIAFAAAQSSSSDVNTLDDYEEGTWTPSDASGAGLSLTVATSQYIKIGQLVLVQYDISYPVTASGATTRISGLPFTCQNAIGYGGPAAFTNVATTLSAKVNVSATTFDFFDSIGTALTNATLSTKAVRGSFSYRAAD